MFKVHGTARAKEEEWEKWSKGEQTELKAQQNVQKRRIGRFPRQHSGGANAEATLQVQIGKFNNIDAFTNLDSTSLNVYL